jgi:two-component system, OmpR family, sensor histidine kinase SenX3
VALVLGVAAAVALGLIAGWVLSSVRVARLLAPMVGTTSGPASLKQTAQRALHQHRLVVDDAAQQLELSTHFREAIDGLPHGVVLVGAPMDDRWRNAAAQALLGSGRVEALLEAGIADERANALAGRAGSQVIEVVGPPKRTYSLQSVPLGRAEQPFGLVTITDLTEMARLERVRRELIANVSHELRTPVGAMAVLAETLQDEDDLAVVNRLSAKIVSEAHRLSRTITDLLELSVLESSGRAAAQSRSALSLVREAVSRAEWSAETLDVGIDTTGVNPAHMVQGDVAQLTSAIGNLLENAVKYSNRGGAVVVASSVSDGMVTLSVVDRGVGIPARDLERVFERFYRVDTARSRVTGGTGLGLAIVRHVAENHSGSVSVESIEGKGSTFRLTVPAAPDSRVQDVAVEHDI